MEAINTHSTPPSGDTPEYIAEMVAKANAAMEPPKNDGDGAPKNEPERPEWLPEKFKTVEDFVKSYGELEKKLGGEKPAEPPKGETPPEGDAEAAKKLVESKGLDFSKFESEYLETGTLSDEAFKALEEAGIGRNLVENYLAGQQALTSQITNQAYSIVGGEAEYKQMIEWAKDALSEGEIDAFNRSLGDLNQAKFAIQGLAARYRSEVGKAPKLLEGQTSGSSAGVFRSAAELTAAMSDPRYANDPAYRADVMAKLARSNIF